MYQNYDNIMEGYGLFFSKQLLLASIIALKRVWHILQAFPTVYIFQSVNDAVILVFSSFLVLHGILLRFRSTASTHTLNIQGDRNLTIYTARF